MSKFKTRSALSEYDFLALKIEHMEKRMDSLEALLNKFGNMVDIIVEDRIKHASKGLMTEDVVEKRLTLTALPDKTTDANKPDAKPNVNALDSFDGIACMARRRTLT
jgi:hypothetical protein